MLCRLSVGHPSRELIGLELETVPVMLSGERYKGEGVPSTYVKLQKQGFLKSLGRARNILPV